MIRYIQAFVVLIIMAGAISCRNEEKKQENQTADEAAPLQFSVTLDVIAQKNDDFCVLYTEDGSINFENGIWQSLKGSPNSQNVVFKFPEDVLPTQLRIDLGRNNEQPEIILKSVTMAYGEKSRTIVGQELDYFFHPDFSKCTFDPPSGVIKAVVKEGVRQSPSLYPHEGKLQPEIQNLYK